MSPEARPSTLAGQIQEAVGDCCSVMRGWYGLDLDRLFLMVTQTEEGPQLSLLVFYKKTPPDSLAEGRALVNGLDVLGGHLQNEGVSSRIRIVNTNSPQSESPDAYWENHRLSAEAAGIKIIRAEEITL